MLPCLQGQDQPPFRVRSNLVLLDLLVRNSEGMLVTDLQANEVELLVDGKRKPLEFFARGNSGEDLRQTAPQPGQIFPARLSNGIAPKTVVFFLDLNSLNAGSLKRVKGTIETFLSSRKSQDTRYMLVRFGRGLATLQPLTTQPVEILQHLTGVRPYPEAQSSLSTFKAFSLKLDEIYHGAAPGNDPAALAANLARTFLDRLHRRVMDLSDGLAATSRFLRTVPGRKHLMLYSSGYPIEPAQLVRSLIEERARATQGENPLQGKGRPGVPLPQLLGPDVQDHRGKQEAESAAFKERLNAILSGFEKLKLTRTLQPALDEAARAQVAVYSVDARGLLTGSGGAEASDRASADLLPGSYSSRLRQALIIQPQEFLNFLSEQTSGRAFHNRNDLDSGLEGANREAGNYFVLGFQSGTDASELLDHAIEIRVKRPGMELRYRHHLSLEDSQTVVSNDILTALRYPDLFRSFTVSIEPKVQDGRIRVTTLIPTRELHFLQSQSSYRGTLELYGALYDERGEELSQELAFSKGRRFDFDAPGYQNLRRFKSVSLTGSAGLPPGGRYYIVIAVRQGADGSIACARRQIQIP